MCEALVLLTYASCICHLCRPKTLLVGRILSESNLPPIGFVSMRFLNDAAAGFGSRVHACRRAGGKLLGADEWGRAL